MTKSKRNKLININNNWCLRHYKLFDITKREANIIFKEETKWKNTKLQK